MTSDPRPLTIDIVSDVVCPWCVVGYLQLSKALKTVGERVRFDVRWRPFELNPQMGPDGDNVMEHIQKKYGSTEEQSRKARARLTDIGAQLGFEFRYTDDMRMYNTFRAHQLLAWAAPTGRQTDLKLALFDAFFTRREDVSDPVVLAEVAGRAGLDADEAAAVLNDGRLAGAVRAEQEEWVDRGVQAVPAIVFNSKYLVTGAQDAPTFVKVIDKVLGEQSAA
ncbi:MAG: DsbA family oxidoreductase [Pseudomonadota bacterium]